MDWEISYPITRHASARRHRKIDPQLGPFGLDRLMRRYRQPGWLGAEGLEEHSPSFPRDHQPRPVGLLGVAHRHWPGQVASDFHAVAALTAVAALAPLGAGQVDLGHPAHLLHVPELPQGAG